MCKIFSGERGADGGGNREEFYAGREDGWSERGGELQRKSFIK